MKRRHKRIILSALHCGPSAGDVARVGAFKENWFFLQPDTGCAKEAPSTRRFALVDLVGEGTLRKIPTA